MTAMALAGWVIVIGSYLVIAFSLAILFGTLMHRRDEEYEQWHASHQRPPLPEITYWLEPEPDWRFPARPKPYDQEDGTAPREEHLEAGVLET